MNRFLERLNNGDILVADGATGTNLQKMGLKPGVPPEDLVFDNPELLLQLSSAFLEAGSDILLTCTFGATRLRMKDSPYADRVDEVNRCAAELARRAASLRSGTLVAGSMGPTGLLMEPYGPLTSEEARKTYAEQAKALAEGGVDFLLIETMFALEEASAALEGAQSVTDLPVVVSFSYDRGVRTMMGVKPTQVIQTFPAKGVVAIGANCGTTLENMEKIVQEYALNTPGLPLWVKPNAGQPRMDLETNAAIYDVTPEQMSDYAKRYIAKGARIVGGCCGSTPEHLAAIARAIHN